MSSDDGDNPKYKDDEYEERKQQQELESIRTRTPLFYFMTACPLPFMLVVPIAFALLIGFGWTQEDFVEDQVSEIWIATEGNYAKDRDYADSYGRLDGDTSSFLGMAISRDGDNLFTESRLQEITARMQAVEATTVTRNGITYTWDDICLGNSVGEGTTYKFPCTRLSPMDYFQESRWFFEEVDRVTWYEEVVRGELVLPLIPRFGVMLSSCISPVSDACQNEYLLRVSPEYAEQNGFDPSYASPLSLFSDIIDFEYNTPCKICIEDNYPRTIDGLYQLAVGTFQLLAAELAGTYNFATNTTFGQALVPREDVPIIADMAQKTAQLSTSLTRRDIEDFYFYYVTRSSYIQLGAGPYLQGYGLLRELIEQCIAVAPSLGLTCPDLNKTLADAYADLANHADNVFSSVTTAGSPFPMWSEGDGTGYLFEGSQPVSGSGVTMSQSLTSVFTFLDFNPEDPASYRDEEQGWDPLFASFVSPTTENYTTYVEANPIYSWFMAGLTPADPAQVCGNGTLTGTNAGVPELDQTTSAVMQAFTSYWCTPYSLPTEDNPGEGNFTKQHFARLFYDLLIDSDTFLGVRKGSDDPYTWTNGQACGYTLTGERDPYTGQNESEILQTASQELYYVDEGVRVGPIGRDFLLGGVTPPIGEYNTTNPLQEATVTLAVYVAQVPKDIVKRVKNCNRPGGPVEISEKEAEKVLEEFKEAFENNWNEGWRDANAGDVQFVSFFDDRGAIGSTGRALEETTLDSAQLTAISILLIAFSSAFFLFSTDLVESRVAVTLFGVTLAVLSYFAAMGFGILIGIKVNVTMAWTLPFIIIGLGVDDVYIVLMALKKQKHYSEVSFLHAMHEVVVPVTMTSLVNASMLAILNLTDIPAVYLLSQVAFACIVLLYLSVVFCFPAYCYIDMLRQAGGRLDIFCCIKMRESKDDAPDTDIRQVILYDMFYEPLVLGSSILTYLVHAIIWSGAAALLAYGVYGIDQREVGFGLEQFFKEDNPAHRWADMRTEALGTWPIRLNWGALEYTSPDVQMKMIKQYEDVIDTEYVAFTDSNLLWMSQLLVWTSRHCDENLQYDSAASECGRDMIYPVTNTSCSCVWTENVYGLNERLFPDPRGACEPHSGGICRPGSEMHPDDLADLGLTLEEATGTSFCPVISDWSDDKWQFCMKQWRNTTGSSSGNFIFSTLPTASQICEGEENKDEDLTFPIPYSNSPTLFGVGLSSHKKTLNLLDQTRKICDDDPELRCWMSGIPYDYWTQYEDVFPVLVELSGYSWAIGFGISFLFLFVTLMMEKNHSTGAVFVGSLFGAFMIAVTIILSLVGVVGISSLIDVNYSGLTTTGFVLSVAYTVEYSVHIVHRWLHADTSIVNSLDRVKYAMSFLMLPTFMSFVASVIGVACLGFTDFEFTNIYFFRPLAVVMGVTYFYGCWFLPMFLTYLDFDAVKLGPTVVVEAEHMKEVPTVEKKETTKSIQTVQEKPNEKQDEIGAPDDDDDHAVFDDVDEV